MKSQNEADNSAKRTSSFQQSASSSIYFQRPSSLKLVTLRVSQRKWNMVFGIGISCRLLSWRCFWKGSIGL
ncbi:hypothetical protein C5167_035493 [Papaver somniferum]|uniref:Uncharacterized protein n=1 Tax=Papaver somniferum TaxID=3469 RepID=A0A4Y7KIU3_PAPSO|nr:hypothetical protein C5167_035493 [Papaver somniferum]